MSATPSLEDFPARTHDKLRYADTDRQGHVNNAVFATFLETGRVEVLHGGGLALAASGASFVIARLELDFVGELTWPGRVEVGTRVRRVGTSSVTLEQGVFDGGRLAARATTVIVQVGASGRPQPLSAQARDRFLELAAPQG